MKLLTNSSVSSAHLNSEHLAYVMRRTNRNCNILFPPPLSRKPQSDWIVQIPAPSSQNRVQNARPCRSIMSAPFKEQSSIVSSYCLIELVYICGTQRYLVKMESYLRRWLGGTWYAKPLRAPVCKNQTNSKFRGKISLIF